MSWRRLASEHYPGQTFLEPTDLYFRAIYDLEDTSEPTELEGGMSDTDRKAVLGARVTHILHNSYFEDTAQGDIHRLLEILNELKELKDEE